MSVESAHRLKDTHEETWNRFSHLIKTFREGTDNSSAVAGVDVWWISGTRKFADLTLNRVGPCRSVTCITRAPRRTPKDADHSSRWYSICHRSVGGVTNARGVFLLRGFETLKLSADLPRSISHVLKYGIRGVPCRKDETSAHYKIGDCLSVRNLELPVIFESGFSSTGWSSRPLDPCELCLAFELPDFVTWDASFAVDIVPLQLGRAVMEEVIVQIGVRGVDTGVQAKKSRTSDTVVDESVDHHWLPDLGKWMPGSWADTEIADRAVKADGASIDFCPWNQRITLVLPRVNSHLIQCLEKICHARWCRLLTKSFMSFLISRHGPQWAERLHSEKRQIYARLISEQEEAGTSPKRQRVDPNPLNRG